MKVSSLIAFFLFIGLSQNGFAFHESQCFSVDGSLTRIESEIWGSSQVEWFLNGEALDSVLETFHEESEVLLHSGDVPGRFGPIHHESYSIRVTVKKEDGTALLREPNEDLGNALKELTEVVVCNSREGA